MLKKLDHGLSLFEDTILVFGILSSAILLFINVVLRFCFNSSIVWAEEYAKFAIIWITFSGCGAAVRCDAHMKITALLDVLGKKASKALNTLVIFISMGFSLFLVVYGWQVTASMMATMQTSPSMEIPMYWVYASIPLGGVLMLIRYSQSLARLYHRQEEGT